MRQHPIKAAHTGGFFRVARPVRRTTRGNFEAGKGGGGGRKITDFDGGKRRPHGAELIRGPYSVRHASSVAPSRTGRAWTMGARPRRAFVANPGSAPPVDDASALRGLMATGAATVRRFGSRGECKAGGEANGQNNFSHASLDWLGRLNKRVAANRFRKFRQA